MRTWQEAYRGLLPSHYLDALDVEQRIDAYERFGILTDPDRPIFVFEDANGITGFAGVGASEDDAALGQLYSIYVSASHWGDGTGASLMSKAEGWLRARFPGAVLWVLDGNVRARRFYEKRGWHPDGFTKNDNRGSFVLHEVRYSTTFRAA